MFEGTVASAANGLVRVAAPQAGAELLVAGETRADRGAPVTVAVRPEKLTLHKSAPPAGAANVLAGQIWDIGYLGDWTVFHVKLDSGPIVKLSRANAARLTADQVGWEDRVFVSFPPEAAIVLVS
jgi:putrescine transport system ATP-binding protein